MPSKLYPTLALFGFFFAGSLEAGSLNIDDVATHTPYFSATTVQWVLLDLISDLAVKCRFRSNTFYHNLAKEEYLDVALWIIFEFGGHF